MPARSPPKNTSLLQLVGSTVDKTLVPHACCSVAHPPYVYAPLVTSLLVSPLEKRSGKISYTTPFFIQSGVLKPGMTKKSPVEGSAEVIPAALSQAVAVPSFIWKR